MQKKNTVANTEPLQGPFYHKTQLLLSRGDIVPSGTFEKFVFGLGVRRQLILFFQEYVLEGIRKWEFPDKPSRLKSAFVFDNYDLASNWMRAGTENPPAAKEYVYLVKLQDPNCRYHRGDITWLDVFFNQINTFDAMDGLAQKYWRSEERELNKWEIIVETDLIVEDRLTPIPENGFK